MIMMSSKRSRTPKKARGRRFGSLALTLAVMVLGFERERGDRAHARIGLVDEEAVYAGLNQKKIE